MSFYLATRGNLTADGTNVLQITASGGVSGQTSVRVEYFIRHWSLFAPCLAEPFPTPVFYAPFSSGINDTIIPLQPTTAVNAFVGLDAIWGQNALEVLPPPSPYQLVYDLPEPVKNKWTLGLFIRPDSVLGPSRTFFSVGAFSFGISGTGNYTIPNVANAGATSTAGQFVTATYDRGMLRFFINGVQTAMTNASLFTIGEFSVGETLGGGSTPLGYIREFVIFDRILTDAQIRRLADDTTPFIPQ